MSLDLVADPPGAVVIQAPFVEAAVLGTPVDQGDLPEPPIPADADLRQTTPEMPVDVAGLIALARTMPAEAFRASLVLRCQAWLSGAGGLA